MFALVLTGPFPGLRLPAVFNCPDGRCADKCDAWADLPEDLLVVTMRKMVESQHQTQQLLATYREKVCE
jgi:hypothetical protein